MWLISFIPKIYAKSEILDNFQSIDSKTNEAIEYKMVSQNVRGISKEFSKLESIVSLMAENNVDACLLKET